jgi:aminopeptidase N
LQAEAGEDVDLQWRALVRKSTFGGDAEAEAESLLARDPDPDAKYRVLAVRAARPDAEAKAAAWQAMAVDRAVPIGSMNQVGAAFWRPGQDDVLAPYAQRYLDLLPELQRGGMIPAMVYTSRLFPLFGVDAEFLSRATAAAESAAPVVRASLLEQADRVERMLRSRG